MKVLILSSLKKEESLLGIGIIKDTIKDRLKTGYDLDWVDLVDKSIEFCTGCGYCGYKNPGVCIKDDDMVDIYPKMANYELQIWISPISFGGYDSTFKKVIDRYCPLGLPTYKVYKGQLHHPARYPNPVTLVSIGLDNTGSKKQEDTFRLTANRMAIASFADESSTIVINRDSSKQQVLNKLREGFGKVGIK